MEKSFLSVTSVSLVPLGAGRAVMSYSGTYPHSKAGTIPTIIAGRFKESIKPGLHLHKIGPPLLGSLQDIACPEVFDNPVVAW
jgi:hypothetical protein